MLHKWKKKPDNKCDVCRKTETIEHLIFECSYATLIWLKINEVLKRKIKLIDIILGINIEDDTNMIISLIVYLIYKEWINISMNSKKRQKKHRNPTRNHPLSSL